MKAHAWQKENEIQQYPNDVRSPQQLRACHVQAMAEAIVYLLYGGIARREAEIRKVTRALKQGMPQLHVGGTGAGVDVYIPDEAYVEPNAGVTVFLDMAEAKAQYPGVPEGGWSVARLASVGKVNLLQVTRDQLDAASTPYLEAQQVTEHGAGDMRLPDELSPSSRM